MDIGVGPDHLLSFSIYYNKKILAQSVTLVTKPRSLCSPAALSNTIKTVTLLKSLGAVLTRLFVLDHPGSPRRGPPKTWRPSMVPRTGYEPVT